MIVGKKGIKNPLAPRKKVNRRMGPRNGEGPTQALAASYSRQQGATKPEISSQRGSGDLRIRVRHREYVADLDGNGGVYDLASFSINPGLSGTFPWLSGLARNFESYQFNDLGFQFRTAQSTAGEGKAILSVDWDAADAAPTTKVAQMQNRTLAENVVWQNIDLVCDRQDLHKFGTQRFIRTAALAANQDIKTYDVGNLQAALTGNSSSGVGELWVVYDVELITPQPPDFSSGVSQRIAFGGSAGSGIWGSASVSTGFPIVTVNSSGLCTFNQPGEYLMAVEMVGTVLTGITPAGTVTVTEEKELILASALEEVALYTIRCTAAGQTLSMPSGATTVSSSITRIAPYTYSLS